MVYNSLAEHVFFTPAENGADHLYILTKNATPNMASWLLKNLVEGRKDPISITLLIDTAASDGISISFHEGFCELRSLIIRFACSYVYEKMSIDSNMYIWLKGETPVAAFNGSADFLQGAFLGSETDGLTECDIHDALEKYRMAESSSIYCHHAEVEEHVRIYQSAAGLGTVHASANCARSSDCDEVFLSLVTKKTGEPGTRSGLNWGQRKGRNPNQAYIPLPSKIAKSGFFPVDPIDSPPHFTVVTDDNHQLILRVEQQNQKAIATPLSNAQLGEYFRNRLSLAYGAYVTRNDLERYGRTDVKFVKLDSEHYYMDFSI